MTATTVRRAATRDTWIQGLIVTSSVVFILVLALSAVFDASIRVLHAFQAAIYVAVVIFAGKRSACGYGAGCLIAAFWNWTNLVHTTFVTNGLRELSQAVQTGQVRRPDQLIAVLAAGAHFVLIFACLVGYARIRPKTSWEPVKFLTGGLLAITYFAGIIVLFGGQYVIVEASVPHLTIVARSDYRSGPTGVCSRRRPVRS